MSYQVTTSPAAEPLLATDLNSSHLHVTDAAQQAYIDKLIKAVRQYIERRYDRGIVTQTITEKWDDWPLGDSICLTVGPAQSIAEVRYRNESDILTIWTASNYYFKQGRLQSYVVLNSGTDFPDIALRPDAVEIDYVVGNDVADIPESVVHAIRLAVTNIYLTQTEQFGEVTESFETSGNFQSLVGDAISDVLFFPERIVRV